MLFSIITITLNNLDGLKKTATSVQTQICTDYEWLVIDGGSGDGTIEYLKTTNATWTSESDNGLYDAMNKGIERASGDYLIFMNAGDEFSAPEVLAHIASFQEQIGVTPTFIYGDALEEQHGKRPAYKKARPFTKIFSGLFTHHQAMFYAREHIKKLRYDLKYAISADYKFTAEFLRQAPLMPLYVDAPICLFETGGVSQQNAKQGRLEQLKIRKELDMCSDFTNRLIYIKQALGMCVRRIFPRFYWRLKR